MARRRQAVWETCGFWRRRVAELVLRAAGVVRAWASWLEVGNRALTRGGFMRLAIGRGTGAGVRRVGAPPADAWHGS